MLKTLLESQLSRETFRVLVCPLEFLPPLDIDYKLLWVDVCLPESRHGLMSPVRWLDACRQKVFLFYPLLVQMLRHARSGI